MTAPVDSATAAIRRALDQPLELKYDSVPLEKVAADLEAKLGIPVRLDHRAIKDAKTKPHAPVKFAVAKISARSAIDLMLRPLGLAAVTRYEVLLITTRNEAENMLETRVYDVNGAVGRNRDANNREIDQPDFDSLIDAITSNVRPTSWDCIGGPGSILPFESGGVQAIVVAQTEFVHREFEALLSKVRSVAHAHAGARPEAARLRARPTAPPLPTGNKPSRPIDPAAAIRAALGRPLDVKYDKTPLDQVAADLQIKLAIPVQLDRKAIEDVGESIAKPVTFSSSGVSAKATVALLLREFSFAAVIHDEVLLITSQEEAENIEETRVYDVADLVGVGDEKDFDTLIDAISGCVSPNTWPVGTGPGPIAPLTVSGTDLIVLSQTADVQDEIENLLADLRAVRHGRQAKDLKSPKLPVRSETLHCGVERPLAPPADPAEAAIRAALAKPLAVQYARTPLAKVAEDLQARLGVPVRLDDHALADCGLRTDAQLTLTCSKT